MDEDTLVVKKASNGATFKHIYYGLDDLPLISREVIEKKDEYSDESQQDAEFGQRVCYWILDWLGIYGSKHNKYRLEINVVCQERE